jgi:hypothetical protein
MTSVIFAAVLATSSASADTWNVPDDFLTIQAAIDAAVNGDEVVIADGTYIGDGNRDLDFGGKAITVRSANGPDLCIIDIQGSALNPRRAFYFGSGETVASVVQGLTIERGFMNRGGAVLCESGSSPLFQSCVFRHNTALADAAGDGGGAVYNFASSPTFNNCEFRENDAVLNVVGGTGGGVMRNHSGSNLTLNSCNFIDNSAGNVGVMAVVGGSSVTAHDCEFSGNEADGGAGAGDIGAIVVASANSSGTFVDCQFTGNNAAHCCGTVALVAGATAEFTDCTFIGNSATTDGAGLVVQFSASAVITNCLFADNQSGQRGGGLWVGDEAVATVTNCTFSGNAASSGGGGLAVRNGANVTVDNSIVWNNSPNEIHLFNAVLAVSYSDVQSGWLGMGNIEADPLFVDPAGDDFHLSSGSLCIDAANNIAVPAGVTTDLDGNPRFLDDVGTVDTGVPGNGHDEIVDMGAYEFQGTSCPWDCTRTGDGNVGISDFLLLLAQWDGPGSCDIDGGGVGITDFLALLANWGPCP